MKNITKIIKKVLKEETKDNTDYLMFVTMTGGRLLIPKSANPVINSSWNSNIYFSNLNTLEEIRNWALKDKWAKDVCKTYHKDKTLDSCYAILVQHYNDISVDGGVVSFTATLPDGNREKFNACFKTRENGKVLDFQDRFLSGYYPQATPDGCFGNPWSLNQKKGEKNSNGTPDSDNKNNNGSSGGDTQDINFRVSLPMTKG